MTEFEIRDGAAKIVWWHSMPLAANFVTAGRQDVAALVGSLGLPPQMEGKRVLDVGTWDGGLAFEAERRGASEVVAIDTWESGFGWKVGEKREREFWDGGLHPRQTGFAFAHEALGSKVRGIQMDLMDASPQKLGVFDIVLMCGVLYHLRHPVLAIEIVCTLCRELLILETHLDMLDVPGPVAAYYPGAELGEDLTNWWGPNIECVNAWLTSSGFSSAEFVAPRGIGPRRGRGVFHARV